ncbi:pseudouridine-5'-phosphate glycosidase [Antarcticirhabdus aurantiaca]|uniref:Pseudouridine-5'-phosphate glycosidase n=1 Tax=Antarcticirhabdus aurantiaca TaxID=2606717 RepID=A0ACD4NV14_9HYPH|nr:pseudouridine-5'-phosphate glycosidase [Antarcticirhabdus aurantiaca]WAJ30683.1 pseudouridine-5'-phosphate glycosidase [Jeongeuplla avenae]
MNDLITLSAEVADALAAKRPVVALESTIITHGMPWPRNLEMARRVEGVIRDNGAVPATIAVIDGRIHAGLDDATLETLAQTSDALKLSRADLAYAVHAGRTGATTVAATMIGARLAGVDVFATGGIGGVHRGASESFDISADLEELSKTDTIVVCAGAKAILDLEKTLEVLETKGVPVIGYGTDELPAFWSRTSGLAAPLRFDSAAEIAGFAGTRRRLGLAGGVLVANPVPEAAAIDAAVVKTWIDAALAEAEARGIKGKAVTPFLLSKMFDLSEGRSLETNIALVLNNAELAAKIAVALARERGAA